jgi:hypothetical protein
MVRGSIITTIISTMISTLALATAGCFESVAPETTPDASTTEETPDGDVPSGRVTTTRGADGTYTTIVDSTSMTEWVHGDLETGRENATPADWDLRFQRFNISVNGGPTGGGGVMVAPVPNVAFADMTSVPAGGWITDAPDGDDTNSDPDYAFGQDGGWYDYNQMTHKLSPKPIVWAIKTTGGAALKLEIKRYYDDAGTAGWLELHWAPLAGGH